MEEILKNATFVSETEAKNDNNGIMLNDDFGYGTEIGNLEGSVSNPTQR